MKPIHIVVTVIGIIAAIVGVISLFVFLAVKFPPSSMDNNVHRQHTITLYSNTGTQIQQWTSEGSVTRPDGNNYYFTDSTTHQTVRISGTVVVQ